VKDKIIIEAEDKSSIITEKGKEKIIIDDEAELNEKMLIDETKIASTLIDAIHNVVTAEKPKTNHYKASCTKVCKNCKCAKLGEKCDNKCGCSGCKNRSESDTITQLKKNINLINQNGYSGDDYKNTRI